MTATGHRRLLPPDEFVERLRRHFCTSGATVGRRPLGRAPLPIYGGAPPARSARDHEDPLDALRRDPVGAALAAEDAGNPMLARDCWVLAGDLAGAVACQEPATPGMTAQLQSEFRLGITLIAGSPPHPADLLAVVAPRVTNVALAHPAELLAAMQARFDVDAAAGAPIAQRLLTAPDVPWSPWPFLNATPKVKLVDDVPWPRFGSSAVVSELLGAIHRAAENALREDIGLPGVGQGWVSETQLFVALQSEFRGETTIEQHGRPDGLGRQHLDVWFPDWRIGVEHHGLQHDEPVEFFGGAAALEEVRRRDARKARACSRLGITLIVVRPGYDFARLAADVRQAAGANAT